MPVVVALYFFRLENSSGGAERMLLRVASDLAGRGYNVHIISWDALSAESFYPVPENVDWHRLGGSNAGALGKLRRAISLQRVLRRIKAQVLIGFVMSADKTVYAGSAMAHVPIIAAERNSPEMYDLKFGAVKKWFYMNLFRAAKRVLVQLDGYRTGYPHWLHAKIEVIPNPISPPGAVAFPGERAAGAKWRLLCVARLEEQKNIESLLRAFSIVESKVVDWELRIVGEGSLRSMLIELTEELGIRDQVDFLGAISDVESEYSAAHLFCLPSVWEGFPNALAEAMAHGLPVAGYAGCPGVNELIEHNNNGLLAAGNGDAVTLADVLFVLMTDAEKRRMFGRRAAAVAEKFDSKTIADRWEQVIVSVVGNHV